MKCSQAREEMFGLAAGAAGAPAVEEHLRTCSACTAQAAEFRQTMALLDVWEAPEPSPFFDARLRARMHEAPARRTVREWLADAISPFTATGRRVALGVAMTLLLGLGVTLMQPHSSIKSGNHQPAAEVAPGSAVAELDALDKNADLYADFDLLDDVSNQ